MPPRSESAASVAAEVRRLQRRLPELAVPALLRLRDALGPVLAAERITVGDVDAVLAVADAR
jgi:hypothetical protein